MAKLICCSFTFDQEQDCCGDDDLGQTLEIRVEDGGDGPFWVVKTSRWAVDDLKEFHGLLSKVVDFTRENME